MKVAAHPRETRLSLFGFRTTQRGPSADTNTTNTRFCLAPSIDGILLLPELLKSGPGQARPIAKAEIQTLLMIKRSRTGCTSWDSSGYRSAEGLGRILLAKLAPNYNRISSFEVPVSGPLMVWRFSERVAMAEESAHSHDMLRGTGTNLARKDDQKLPPVHV